MKRIGCRLTGALCVLALLLCAGGCRDTGASNNTKTLSARIVDETGRPIPGAIFYAEAYTFASGVIDFTFAKAGPNGEIPAAGTPAPTLGWHKEARLALAAFAPNRKPFCLYSHNRQAAVEADGVALPLAPLPRKGLRWEPRLGQLGFPFEEKPELAQRLAQPDYSVLRAAFLKAYAPLANHEETATPQELKKLEFLQAMEAKAAK